ncbi:MAG: 1-acyl-sn-glycerol-3-phosphate acyltransferase [Lachnospiraceae bacterium]|nr:1-acyl-sn-glycerol-3-phosphate acyltransferase [Lachnospiraceae bacterium]
MIRIIIAGIFVAIFLIVSIPIQLAMVLYSFIDKEGCDRKSLAIVNSAFRTVIKIAGVKETVLGIENVPKDEAVLYVINHRSIFDIVLTYAKVPRPTGYIAKKEMNKFLTLSTWMMFLHCEFLDRGNLRQGMKVIKRSAKNIQDGISMAIFPEGTRNKTNEDMLPFHKGSFKIAEMAKCKIVPVVLNNTPDIFENHVPRLKSVHVVVEYLPPVDVQTMTKEERKTLTENIRAQMIETYNKNMALV